MRLEDIPVENLPAGLTDSFFEAHKIAGFTSQNQLIDRKRQEYIAFQNKKSQSESYNKIIDELHKSNELMQEQIDEAKREARKAKSKAFWASFRSWLSIVITIGSLAVAIAALCLPQTP